MEGALPDQKFPTEIFGDFLQMENAPNVGVLRKYLDSELYGLNLNIDIYL